MRNATRSRLTASERVNRTLHFPCDATHCLQELCIHGSRAGVLEAVAATVSLVEHPPFLGCHPQCMGECLENDVALVRPIAMPSERGKGQRVGCVVRQIEPALRR